MNLFKYLLAALAVMSITAPFAVSAQDDEDTHHQLEQIVVTATPLNRTINEIAQPTNIISGSELRKKLTSSIGETLAQEPGVNSTYFGPISSRPVIRGQSGERISVLSNGLDSLDASAISDDHQVTVEGLLVDRVEIIRGPATLLYGSGAAGGLVNVVDTRALDERPDDAISGAAQLGTDSALGSQEISLRSEIGSENSAFNFDYFRRSTKNIRIPGFAESEIFMAAEEGEGEGEGEEEEAFGVVENTDSTTSGGSAGVAFFSNRGFVRASLMGFNSNYGIPGHHHHHEEDEDGEDHDGEDHGDEEESVRLDLRQRKSDVRGEYSLDSKLLNTVKFKVSTSDYTHTEFEGDEVGTVFNVDGLDSRFELTHNPLANLEGALGIQYKIIDFDVTGDEAYVPKTSTSRMSLFAFEELKLNDNLTLQGSLRVENQKIEGPTISQSYNNSGLSGSAGAIWNLQDDLTISTNLALTERHPTAADLFANGPHIAAQRYERGLITLNNSNNLPEVEESTNLDLTMRGNTGIMEWTITGFSNRVENYILLKKTSLEIDELPVYDVSRSDVYFYGLEAEALFEIWDAGNSHLHLNLFTDFTNAEERDSGAYLPRIPSSRVGFELHGGLNQLDVSLDATFADKQSKVSANELATEGYKLVNLNVSYTLEDPNILLFLRGSNLLDEEIRRHTSALKDLVPSPGRSLYAGLTYEF